MIIVVRTGPSFGTSTSVLHLAAALGIDLRVIPEIASMPAHWFEPVDVPPLLHVPHAPPRKPFRTAHRPGLSGKRTRHSQRFHNRRAA